MGGNSNFVSPAKTANLSISFLINGIHGASNSSALSSCFQTLSAKSGRSFCANMRPI